MSDNDKEDNYSSKLGDPIFLDYDVNKLRPIVNVSHIEKLGTIKKFLEKSGFERAEEIYKGFIRFEKTKKERKVKKNHVG